MENQTRPKKSIFKNKEKLHTNSTDGQKNLIFKNEEKQREERKDEQKN